MIGLENHVQPSLANRHKTKSAVVFQTPGREYRLVAMLFALTQAFLNQASTDPLPLPFSV